MLTLSLDELIEVCRVDNAATGAAVVGGAPSLQIEQYGPDLIVASVEVADEHARKGGSIAGGTIFRFFDSMGYMATLAQSPRGTEAYTTDVTIHFLRPGPVGRIVVEGRPLKFGRRASIVDVTVSSPAVADGPIASGVVTYAPVFPEG